jgi:hypothetical protein
MDIAAGAVFDRSTAVEQGMMLVRMPAHDFGRRELARGLVLQLEP